MPIHLMCVNMSDKMLLAELDGDRIKDDRTPRRISQRLAERMDMDIPEVHAGRMAGHRYYGGEADGLASTVRTCFRPNTWAEIASVTDYDPDNIPQSVFGGLSALAEEDPEPFRHLGRMLAVIGERYARVATEKALEEHCDDARVAEIELENENIDMTCDAGNVQVYTGTSDKYWYNKSNAPETSKSMADMDIEKAVEQTNFDVFVFVRIVEGELYAGAKTIANHESEKSAPAKAKP